MLREYFWQLPLKELNGEEWDALCDGCGKCCLVKLQDEDDESIVYTSVACEFLSEDCRCSVYSQRQEKKPECAILTPESIEQFHYLPSTCAYRLRAEDKPLFAWHPLIAGGDQLMIAQGHSMQGSFCSEDQVAEEDLIHFIIDEIE